MLLAGVGAHQTEAPVGVLGTRGPDLLAVDQEVVALVLGAGLEGRKVRTRARLGEALAPLHVAAADQRDMLKLLVLGAVLQEGGAEHHHAHAADGVVGPGAAEFLLDDPGLSRPKAAAAVLAGPGGGAPALGANRLAPGFLGLGRLRTLLAHHRVGPALQLGGEIGIDPFAHFLAEGFRITASKISHKKSPSE